MTTLEKIKLAIRRSHDKLDEDLQADIDACLADLRVVGVIHATEEDPLIFNAVKLYCRSTNTDDPAKAARFREGYDGLKASLMDTEEYIEEAESDG